MKYPDIYLKEYCQRLSDENLKFLAGRFSQKLTGDLADILNFISNNKDIDRWLASIENVEDFYYALDTIQSHIMAEHEKRSDACAA